MTETRKSLSTDLLAAQMNGHISGDTLQNFKMAQQGLSAIDTSIVEYLQKLTTHISQKDIVDQTISQTTSDSEEDITIISSTKSPPSECDEEK